MFGLESVGPGRDVRVEGAGVPEFETPLGAPAAELAAQAWRGQVDEPRDDKLSELRTWVDGLPAKLRDSFLGEAVAGFEEVSNGIRDGLLQGVADAIRDAENLGARLAPIRDAARALISPVEGRVEELSEEQLEVLERLAGLEDRRGFAQGYQARNLSVSGSGSSLSYPTWEESGGAKGASVHLNGVRIVEPGVWTVHFQATGAGTAAIPGFNEDTVRAHFGISITPLEGGAVVRDYVKELVAAGGTQPSSLSVSFPVVVPEGHSLDVTIGLRSGRNRKFMGGERWSCLAVVKRDVEAGPQGKETVPDA